jgi:hypothetical protein
MDFKGKQELLKNGLYVNAVFNIPSSKFQSNIILVSKKSLGSTFIARLSQDVQTNKSILQNFNLKKGSKIIELGCFVDFAYFKSFDSYKSEIEMNEMVKRIGISPIPVSEILTSINLLNIDKIDDVELLTNSIYLPESEDDPVVSSISELKFNAKKIYQIQFDETKANSIYIANFFNSEIGKKLRGSIKVGAYPTISKAELLKSTIFLPDLSTQVELIKIDSKIQQFLIKLDELKRNLWKKPNDFKSITKELNNLNKEDNIESWIDKLPFPISSILWRYYATKDNSKKIEHLFHFYEAYSEFLSMLMLSALVQDQDFYKAESYRWISSDEKFKNWYEKATFGSWNILTSRLSKAIREYLSDIDLKEKCKNLFGNPSTGFLSMISNRRIINILNEVADLRNKWKGHGGITSNEENYQRLLTLEKLLNELRKYIADAFEDSKILSPTTGSYENGVFTFNAKELLGARTPFNETTINSLIPLDRKKLYLFNTDHASPLELLPFIKFVESSGAIYFYTSIESKKVRWVSYHFEKESELNQPADNELFKAFDFLK